MRYRVLQVEVRAFAYATVTGWMRRAPERAGRTGAARGLRLYALDSELDVRADATREDVLAALRDHVLDEGELMGRYSR
jgi:hypothetical protein